MTNVGIEWQIMFEDSNVHWATCSLHAEIKAIHDRLWNASQFNLLVIMIALKLFVSVIKL